MFGNIYHLAREQIRGDTETNYVLKQLSVLLLSNPLRKTIDSLR